MDNRKVTGGIPSLTPEKRDSISLVEKTRDRDTTLLTKKIACDTATVAPDGDADVTNAEMQRARVLPTEEIKRRLKLMNQNLQFEIAWRDPTKTGIYIVENPGEKRFVCGMETVLQPEFSIREDTMERVPDPKLPGAWKDVVTFSREIRGWRTVLARLLREKLITEPQIEQYFKVSQGRSSENWQKVTT